MSDTLNTKIKELFDPLKIQQSTWWPFYRRMDSPFDNWSEKMKEPWLAIIDGSIKNVIRDKVLEVLLYAGKLEGL